MNRPSTQHRRQTTDRRHPTQRCLPHRRTCETVSHRATLRCLAQRRRWDSLDLRCQHWMSDQSICRTIRLLIAVMSSLSRLPWFSRDRQGRRCPCDRPRSGSSQGSFRKLRARSSAGSPHLRLSYLMPLLIG